MPEAAVIARLDARDPDETSVLLAHWNVRGITEVRDTASEADRTTLVFARSGDVVLKSFPDGSDAAHMQVALLAAAARAATPLPVPALLIDERTGSPLDPAGTTFVATLRPGIPLEDAELTASLVDAIAAAQAALLDALRGVDASAARVPDTNDWSLDAVLRHAPLVDVHLDAELSRIAHLVISDYRDRVSPILAGMPRQVLHADFNLSNLLVTDGALTGIIDFGDAVRAPRVFDVAVTAAYLSMRLSATDHPLVERYLARMTGRCALDDAELAVLPTLMLCRVVMALVLGRETAQSSPERAAYQLRYDALATRLLAHAALPPTDDHPHGKKHQ
ncbi:phosphotransferase [Microbacterium sp. 18062]|uniref:phosphotransferase n=1 Tax=Microbacterium sp. 18062 TaxID=2681410 RepID=UPI00135B633B|nr:phosphotransferase [Microbacterium sp. 18062]